MIVDCQLYVKLSRFIVRRENQTFNLIEIFKLLLVFLSNSVSERYCQLDVCQSDIFFPKKSASDCPPTQNLINPRLFQVLDSIVRCSSGGQSVKDFIKLSISGHSA